VAQEPGRHLAPSGIVDANEEDSRLSASVQSLPQAAESLPASINRSLLTAMSGSWFARLRSCLPQGLYATLATRSFN
jgi:hypothetical protein